MSNSEIIEWLKKKAESVTMPGARKMYQAAVKALEEQKDMVSRKTANVAICNACGKIDCDQADKCEKLQLPPANCSEFPNSSDTISRQAAIEALYHVDEYNGRSVEAIRNLPPARPEQLSTNLAEVGTDAVSREAVKELAYSQIRSMYCGVALKEQRETMLRIADNVIGLLAPVASKQPEIVRCKDCKHWIPYDWMFSEVWRSKNMADYSEDEIGCNLCDVAMKANDFCSRGERRTDE